MRQATFTDTSAQTLTALFARADDRVRADGDCARWWVRPSDFRDWCDWVSADTGSWGRFPADAAGNRTRLEVHTQ